jgi:hypothetical protein
VRRAQRSLGRHGVGRGADAEQLHAAEVKRFGSYENAWEAHKVRNRIAHEGVKFELTQNEAKRVYKLYATVFEEFGIVI